MQITSKTTGPRIVIIGGGATGTGIAREAAQRGYAVTLVERGQLGQGTSGRFHGILHSGARYAENQLRRLKPSAITDTGGMFGGASNPSQTSQYT